MIIRTLDLSLRNVEQGYLDSIDALKEAVRDRDTERADLLESLWLELHTDVHNGIPDDPEAFLSDAEEIAETAGIYGITSEGWYYVATDPEDVP